jgi:flagellar M-ring protein FliF
MPARLSSALGRIAATIRGFTFAQRTIAVIGVVVIVVGITALAVWASRPAYTPLFTGLQPADASSIVDQLKSDGVSYELADGGATVMVPQQNVYDERIKAASAGLPSSSTTQGYALLDKMGVTSSEFQQDVTYKRAMEGELASTIQSMKGVKTASVQLAIPEQTVFDSQKSDPTASVFIQTQAGATLTTDQVQAIVHLTSASVNGMKPTDVAVVDASGEVLSAVGTGATGGADKQASDYESKVRGAVQDMLDKVVGPGNASVVVTADMSNETATRTEESYTAPTDAPSLSEQSSKETYTGSGGAAAGVLGPDNIAVPGGGSGNGAYSSESTTKDNALDKVTEQRTIPAGAITKQSVSVALNKKASGNVSQAEIESLVSTAAGIDAKRGDDVTVQFVDFSNAGAKAAAKALQQARDDANTQRLTTMLGTAGIVLLALTVLVVATAVVRRRRRAAVDEFEPEETTAAIEATLPFTMLETTPTAPTLPLPIEPRPDDRDGLSPGADRARAEIEALAERDPERTAEFLRGLLDDRQNA